MPPIARIIATEYPRTKTLGDRGFLEILSKKLGYKLNFRSKGRPKKECVPKYPHALAAPTWIDLNHL